MSAFFIVKTGEGPKDGYYKHWATFDQALADFLRIYNEGQAETIKLEFSS